MRNIFDCGIFLAFVLICLFTCGQTNAEEEKESEISIGIGGEYNDKKESRDNEFSTKLSYKDTLHNSYSIAYTIKKQGTKGSLNKYNSISGNIEQNIWILYFKTRYTYDSERQRHNGSLSTGKTFKFGERALRFDTGCSYTKYPDREDWKVVLNSNYIKKKDISEFAIRFHQRFDLDFYDYWFETSLEIEILDDYLSGIIAFQKDHESYYKYTETEIKYGIKLKF